VRQWAWGRTKPSALRQIRIFTESPPFTHQGKKGQASRVDGGLGTLALWICGGGVLVGGGGGVDKVDSGDLLENQREIKEATNAGDKKSAGNPLLSGAAIRRTWSGERKVQRNGSKGPAH